MRNNKKDFYKKEAFDNIKISMFLLSEAMSKYDEGKDIDMSVVYSFASDAVRRLSNLNRNGMGGFVAGHYVSKCLNDLCGKKFEWEKVKTKCIQEHVNDVKSVVAGLAGLNDKSPGSIYKYLNETLAVAFITRKESAKLNRKHKCNRLKDGRTGFDVYDECGIDLEWVEI